MKVRNTTPELLRGGAGGRRPGHRRLGGRGRLGDHRLGRMRFRRGGVAANPALAALFDHDLLGPAVAEVWCTVPVSTRGLSVKVFVGHSVSCRQEFSYQPFSSPNLLRCAFRYTYWRIPGHMAGYPVVIRHPVSDQEHGCVTGRSCSPAREQGCMYHI